MFCRLFLVLSFISLSLYATNGSDFPGKGPKQQGTAGAGVACATIGCHGMNSLRLLAAWTALKN